MVEGIVQADAIDLLYNLSAKSVDLVFGSPPYENARLYLENGEDVGLALKTSEWVDFMVSVYRASLRACKGLVAYVVEGRTKNFSYTGAPLLLGARLLQAGITLRKPPAFHRVGIPGSGGPDWLRNDWEFCLCATNGGQLPWSDHTACGHPPKFAPGGEMSYRNAEGQRKNKRHRKAGVVEVETGSCRRSNGDREVWDYVPPKISNPGNVIHCKVGGGQMGSKLAHENEAPMPETLTEFFIKSFCPPGGLVVDPFAGSGTTLAVAKRLGRRYAGCDIRQSQVELTQRRLAEVTCQIP